jgi:hypothetical protein
MTASGGAQGIAFVAHGASVAHILLRATAYGVHPRVGDRARQIASNPSLLQLRRSSSATSRNCTGFDDHQLIEITDGSWMGFVQVPPSLRAIGHTRSSN